MNPHDELLQTPAPRPTAWRWHWPDWLPVRRLAERHRERVLTHLLALDERDRYLRFGHIATDEQIAAYARGLDFARDELFGIFDARLRLVATAHLAYDTTADHGPGTAEFGVSVLPRGRGRGFGRRLFTHSVLHARNRGAHTLVIHLARENAPMLAIVRRSGAAIRYEGGDAVAHLRLPEPSVGSRLDALVEEQAAQLDFRVKLEALRWSTRWRQAWAGRAGPPAPR